MSGAELDPGLLSILRCPRDQSALRVDGARLVCECGHDYPVIEGVPVLLLDDRPQTIGVAVAALAASEHSDDPLHLDTLGISESEKQGIVRDWRADGAVDAVVSYIVGATSGYGYAHVVGGLRDYPIPDIPVEAGHGRRLLDIGSNWGRWSVSAARKGWTVVGLDPSLGALLAAKRAFSKQGLPMTFVCGDARFLPFETEAFDAGFSYSVLQHFSHADARMALTELGRVLAPGGTAKIQMAHRGGLRSTYMRTRPTYSDSGPFRVRYWTLAAMRDIFGASIGPTTITPEAFGGLGLLSEDWKVANGKAKALIVASSVMRRASRWLPGLIGIADSVYVQSRKSRNDGPGGRSEPTL